MSETTTQPGLQTEISPKTKTARQLVKFTFFKLNPEFRQLNRSIREKSKKDFLEAVNGFEGLIFSQSYSLVGVRGDVDFMFWNTAYKLSTFQKWVTKILSTKLGAYLSIPYSYLAMTRRSIYVESHQHKDQEGTRLTLNPSGAQYLFIYPFVKTRDWYKLPKEQRQEMMTEHFAIGHKYPTVRINTTYSYGLDDQEFVLAFETDHPSDFLDLVMDLRESKASSYTLKDTPIFTCVKMEPKGILESLAI